MIGEVVRQAIPVLIGILVFGVLVLIHEWGHFIAARKNGILVEEFAIGMGPKLIGIQRGDTLYSIRLIPMGGYCKMLGDEDESSDGRAFNNKKVWQRIIVILAGAFMNIVLAVLLFIIVVFANGFYTTTVSAVVPASPAEEAGVLPMDRVIKINGGNTRTSDDILLKLMQSKGKPVEVTFLRGQQTFVKTIVPEKKEDTFIIGVSLDRKNGLFEKPAAVSEVKDSETAGFFESLSTGYWQMVFWVKMTVYGIGELVTMNISVQEMSGPIGVVSLIGETYERSISKSIWVTIYSIMQFAGVLSASIGMFNLLPIPALDGGRFMFLLFEAIRRKPIPPEKEGMIHFAGFVVLIAFGIFIAYNDILKII